MNRTLITILTGILLNISGMIMANPVGIQEAAIIAGNMYHMKASVSTELSINQVTPQLLYTCSAGQAPVYYVFGFTGLPGWVIVSADDLYPPVIAYSDKGTYSIQAEDQPPAFIAWMEMIKSNILYHVSTGTPAASNTSTVWKAFQDYVPGQVKSPMSAVSPLTTSLWDQGCNFNNLCPSTGGSHPAGPCNHVVTGCVATAMAMVMKYWNFPAHGTGSHSYTDPANSSGGGCSADPSYGTLSRTFNTNYDWSNMPDSPVNTSTGINVLMVDCGVSVDMNYSYCTSGSWNGGDPIVANAFKNYFYYSSSAQDVLKSGYSDAGWASLMKTELNNSRVIDYGNCSHSWVCDGYDDNFSGTGQLYFHMNWGWSGGSNGYFLLSSTDVGSCQEAVIGIQPSYQVPIPPTDVTASQGDYGGQVIVSWRWASNASYYQVYRSETNNSSTSAALSSWTGSLSYADATALPNHTYYYWVKSATSAAGANASAYSLSAAGYVATPLVLNNGNYGWSNATPFYWYFTNNANYWGAAAVRPDVVTEDWDIYMYSDNTFNSLAASSIQGAGKVDIVMVDGNYTPSVQRGLKTSRYAGSGQSTVSVWAGNSTLGLGTTSTLSWGTNNVVRCWDAYLQPGVYKFTFNLLSGSLDAGIALFSSYGSSNYYYGKSSAIATSDVAGATNETFTVVIPGAAYYGFAVWGNNATTGTYTITLERAGTWTGAVDHNWHNSGNWSAGIVPTADIDVTIPLVTNQPWIWTGNAVCKSLTLQSGSGNYLRVYNNWLTVNNDATFYGELMMDNNVNTTGCEFLGNVFWGSGSSAYVTSLPYIDAYGNWDYQAGATVHFSAGSVSFYGTSDSYIHTYDAGCYFNQLYVQKTGSAAVWYSAASTQDLNIYGDLFINTGAVFVANCDSAINLHGILWDNGGQFYCYYGEMDFNGSSQTITLSTGDYFNNLVINPTTYVNLNSDVLTYGFIKIVSGVLISNSHTIAVGGDWINTLGPGAFTEASGRVIFNGGNYHQYCSNETFNILEVNKAYGGAFRMNGTNVLCATYDWTAGAVDVLSGSFTANSLADNGIAGNYYVNPGGTISLHNPSGYVDLNGNIYIYGGEFDVYGGTTDSYWPFAGNASITMSNGILDFKNVGIKLYNTASYSFAENISGGLIRTVGSFYADRSEFTPSGGQVELYNSGTNTLSCTNGASFNNLLINKIAGNTISMSSPLAINGNLQINAGILSTNSNNITIQGNWTNNVGDAGFAESNSTVTFTGSYPSAVTTDETFYNLNNNKTWGGTAGLEVYANKTVNVLNALNLNSGTMQLDNQSTLAAKNLTFALNAGLNAYSTSTVINISGNWIDNNTTMTTNVGFFHGSSSTVNFIQSLDQQMNSAAATEEFCHFTINKPSGSMQAYKGIRVTGDFNMPSGNFTSAAASLNHYFQGNFNVASGTGWSNNSSTVNFTGTQDQNVLFSPTSGYFYHVTITKPVSTTATMQSDILSLGSGNLVVNSGKLDLNGHYFRCTANVTVNSTGEISIPASSWLEVGNLSALTINTGGKIDLVGSLANPAKLSHHAGYYAFNIESGATISAENAIFEYMNTNGVYVKSGAIVDNLHPFNGCTFRYGQVAGTLFRIDNNQVFNVNNAVFPANSWSGASNVTKSVNQGIVNFLNYTGAFGGTAYENDPNNRVFWMPAGGNQLSGTLTYDNSGSSVLTNTRALLKNGTTVIDSVMTNAAGFFAFPSEPAGTYTLGGRSTKAWGGVNSTDALKTMQHFVHIITLSPLRFKAADVDANATVNSIDALMIMKRFVGQITSFPVGDWAFETPAVNLATGVAVQNYKGICYGDADGSYLPPAKHEPQVQLVNNGVLAVQTGKIISIPVSVTRDLEVGAISLELSGIPEGFSLLGITTMQGMENLVYNYREGNLRIGWANTEPLVLKANDNLLNLEFRVMSVPANGNLRINLETGPDCELADGNADVLYKEVLAMPELLFDNTDAFVLGDCYPNPTAGNGIIPFYLPDDGRVSLSVTDVTGRTLQAYDLGDQNAGNHQFSLNVNELAQGIYNITAVYSTSTGSTHQTRRLIVSR